jgi:hypothetical protein
MSLFVIVLGLVLVVCLWIVGDVDFRFKVILTTLYFGSFGLLFVTAYPFAFMVSQCLLVAVIGAATFGIDFLGRR